jgi:hypothetical protein
MGGSGAKRQALAGVPKCCQTLIKAYIPKGKPWLSSRQYSTPASDIHLSNYGINNVINSTENLLFNIHRKSSQQAALGQSLAAPKIAWLQFRDPCQTLSFFTSPSEWTSSIVSKTCFAGSEGLVTSLVQPPDLQGLTRAYKLLSTRVYVLLDGNRHAVDHLWSLSSTANTTHLLSIAL